MRQFNKDLLRQHREERGLYLKDVAAAVGYSAAAVGQWETGKRNPSATAAKKLADFFGVDSAAFWIAGDTGPKDNREFVRLLEVAESMIAIIPSPAEREIYTGRVAEAIGADREEVEWKVKLYRHLTGKE